MSKPGEIMFNRNSRRALCACLLWMAGTSAYADESGIVLALPDAQALAVQQQPLLEAQAAAVKAAHDSAVVAAQLPDPKLTGGITDWPIDGQDRYSLRRDNFTMVNVGIEQEFPRAEKRRLRGEHEAALAEQTLTASSLSIQRDTAQAWLDVWRPERALELTRASLHQAELQVHATEIAYTASRATFSLRQDFDAVAQRNGNCQGQILLRGIPLADDKWHQGLSPIHRNLPCEFHRQSPPQAGRRIQTSGPRMLPG